MPRFRFGRVAAADIEAIGEFIAQDNPDRAVTFVEELRARCREPADFPLASAARPDLGDDLRMAMFGRYLIFYRLDENVLEIRRVLHSARDLGDLAI